jgi:GNAT superfamily N-acetyltransferase
VGSGELAAIQIRSATAPDAAEIAPLLGQLGYPSTAEDTFRRLVTLTKSESAATLVATESNRVVGVATVQYIPVLHANEPVAQLMLLVVAETHRRRGIGRLLTERVEQWAVDRGCARMLVVTALERADAHAFYESLGYHHTARRYVKRIGPA